MSVARRTPMANDTRSWVERDICHRKTKGICFFSASRKVWDELHLRIRLRSYSRRMKNTGCEKERCARPIFFMRLIFHATASQATKDFKNWLITSEVDNALGSPNYLVKKLALCISHPKENLQKSKTFKGVFVNTLLIFLDLLKLSIYFVSRATDFTSILAYGNIASSSF